MVIVGKATLHGRAVLVLSAPRWVAGGHVLKVTWEVDNEAMSLPDGSVHPAHKRGFTWEEPAVNLVDLVMGPVTVEPV